VAFDPTHVGMIALDLDGTLEDSRDDMVAAVQRVRVKFGLNPGEPASFRDHVNRGMPHLYRECFAEFLAGGGDYADVASTYTRDYSAHIADVTRLYDGMADAIETLAGIAPLAIVTNKPDGLSRLLLRTLGVEHHFAVVVGGDTCSEAKPTPTPLLYACERVGASPESAFMVGDSGGDVACGRAAGTRVIWCAWGYKDAPGPRAPDATANHPCELAEIVRRLAS